MINLELYRVFYVVAESKNITKASEILHISQPAVTKHIKNLESILGEPLFIRTKKGVILNEYGKRIFLNVKQAINLLNNVEEKINELNNSGTITIGISTSLTRKFLLKYIKEFHEIYPNIVLNINTDATKDLIKQLKNGMIDLIISKFPKNTDLELNYSKLGTTKYIFACSDRYKKIINKKINIEELVNYPILLQRVPSNSRISIDNYLRQNNIKIEPSMSIASSNLLIDFIKIGYGIGYVTKLYVKEELESKKLYELDVYPKPEEINYGIITLKNSIMPSYINKFIDYVKQNN